jgi:hypothetical protein
MAGPLSLPCRPVDGGILLAPWRRRARLDQDSRLATPAGHRRLSAGLWMATPPAAESTWWASFSKLIGFSGISNAGDKT